MTSDLVVTMGCASPAVSLDAQEGGRVRWAASIVDGFHLVKVRRGCWKRRASEPSAHAPQGTSLPMQRGVRATSTDHVRAPKRGVLEDGG
jgi:hypothetical protein